MEIRLLPLYRDWELGALTPIMVPFQRDYSLILEKKHSWAIKTGKKLEYLHHKEAKKKFVIKCF